MGEAATSHPPSTLALRTSWNMLRLMTSREQIPVGKGPSCPLSELGFFTSADYFKNRTKPPGQNNFRT